MPAAQSVFAAARSARSGGSAGARLRDAGRGAARPPRRTASALRPEELNALAAIGTMRTFRRQTIILSEGDENDSFYVVCSGRVKVFVSDENGREIVLAHRGPFEYFGETALAAGPRAASVMTLAASRIAIVAKPRFIEFLTGHPRIAIAIMQDLAQRVRGLTLKVKSLALMDVEARVMRLFGELAAVQGSPVIERASHQEIANRVGASREMVSRVMKNLAERGLISIDKKHITVAAPLPCAL